MNTAFSFELPDQLVASSPPEARGVGRDQVRLMVLERTSGKVTHANFSNLSKFLSPNDLLVFNASRTLPASLVGRCNASGSSIEVRLAEHRGGDNWLALLLCQSGGLFSCGLEKGMKVNFGPDLSAEVLERDRTINRLWLLKFSQSGYRLIDSIYRLGKPIRYEYVPTPWKLEHYQNVYAGEPGSAEMPSAGRAFTWKALFDLKKHRIGTAFILLHTGLSSYMDDRLDAQHPASREEFVIGQEAAAKINAARSVNGRIIAVGTTVVRALESAADENGRVTASHSRTRLRITQSSRLKVVDALLTGLHEPMASHLDMLAAFAPVQFIRRSYNEAVQEGYLWHEFGDLNLIV